MPSAFLATSLAACALLAAGALAETDAEEADTGAEAVGIEEIVVTASRRETSLQQTPQAISAYSADALDVRGIDTVEALGALDPSMHVSSFQGEAQVYIRGIGNSSVIGGSDSSTALHADGVYLSRPASALPAFFDVERVEVVRGPQGTLYGRNATGGSVNVITKDPSESFEYEAKLTGGDYGLFRAFGALSGPIGDKLGVRLAVQREKRNGYTTLVRPTLDPFKTSTDDAEDKNEWLTRLTLVAKPSEAVTATIKADYYKADDQGVVWHYFGPGTATNPIYQALVPVSARAEPYSRRIPSDVEHVNRPQIWGLSSKLEWMIRSYRLSSLTAYRRTEPHNRDDLDASAIFGVDQLRSEDQEQVSQEFQLSSPEDGRLTWIAGVYYFDESNVIRNEYFLPFTEDLFALPPDPACCLLDLNGETTTKAWAIFGESTLHVTDDLGVVLGARYSSEKRGGRNLVVFHDAPITAFDNVADFDAEKFDAFTPRVGLNYQLGESHFLYFSYSRGFKSGGFNPGSYQNTAFDPEKLAAYEFGAKSTLFDRRLRANLAAFYYDYEDLQVQDVQNNNVIIRNAAAARVTGVELEAALRPIEALAFDAAFTWLDAEFTGGALLDPKFPALGVQALDGKALPKAPRYKLALGAEYAVELGSSGSLTLRGDYSWQDEIYYSAFNVPDLHQASYGWGKARLTYRSPSERYSLSAFVDNLSDERVTTNKIYDGDIIGSSVMGNLAPPRTFGIEFTFKN